MRLPVNKIYRAFPELDRFTDQQCEAFIQRVKRTEQFKSVKMWIVAIAIPSFFVCAIIECSIGGLVMDLSEHWIHRQRGPVVVIGLFGFVLFTATAVGGMVGRDIFLRRELKHAIWRNIERIRCERCKYSLLGQRVNDGVIHCPECGAVTTLRALGLTKPADLMPPDAGESDTIAG